MHEAPQLIITARIKDDDYDHVDIDMPHARVGSVRYRALGKKAIIYSIQVFPEFQGNGYGSYTIDFFKQNFTTLIADRVRYTARTFWEKMGFTQLPDDDHYEHQWSWSSDHQA